MVALRALRNVTPERTAQTGGPVPPSTEGPRGLGTDLTPAGSGHGVTSGVLVLLAVAQDNGLLLARLLQNSDVFLFKIFLIKYKSRGYNSAGRVARLHRVCRRFDSV